MVKKGNIGDSCLVHLKCSMDIIAQTPILDSQVRFTEQTTTVQELLTELSKAGKFTFSYGKEVPTR